MALLADGEEKTRANAAGALGNLVRNSSQLCGEIIKVCACACDERLRLRCDAHAQDSVCVRC